MKAFTFAAPVLALVLCASAHAANTQADVSLFKATGRTGYVYGRSDGVYQEENTKSPYMIENGTAANAAGFGFFESFTPGVYATVPSAFMTIAGLVQSASAQQLDIAYFGPHAFIFAQSTAQTLLPVMDTIGLDIGGDQVSGEAYEVFTGILGASGRPAVIGVDPAFYFCATFEDSDVSDTSDLHVGWRSATQTQTATITTYLNYATIGFEGTANPNTVYTMTGNDDTDVSTDTTNTIADAVSVEFCTNVSGAGAVTYTINGVAPTVATAFTFDDGDSVIPFVQMQLGGGGTAAVDLTAWEVGYTP